MKTNYLIVLIALTLTSCFYNDDNVIPFVPPTSLFEPTTMLRSDFEASITVQEAKPITETGKIYVIGQYVFINEPYQGFHIVNNVDPTNPIVEKYLVTPGATDLIFKNDSFYINQAVDLVALKFNSSFDGVIETQRVQNIFPQLLSPDGFFPNTPQDEIVINWIQN
ncbi:hypothetical protein [Kordia jejudonensis]|uniref:hypothetical protein n=1 Tax=Kordia jejudonensis TaxID=1348245 RepID=UPI000629851B|nr:hypothetical protein [Kordia jejudonensis]